MRSSGETYRNWAWPTFTVFNSLSLAVCENCALGAAVPELSDEALRDFYGTAFRAKWGHAYLNFGRAPTSFFSHRAVAQLSLATGYCLFQPGDTFLDVGAGEGTSFYAARTLLPSPQLAAIELAEGAEGYFVRNVAASVYPSLEDFIAAGRQAKIILLSHSLEHYRPADIGGLFEGFKKALAADGVLVVEVPNVNLRDHPNWRVGDAPHLLFFNEQSLRLLLERHGFEILFIRTCGHPNDGPVVPEIEHKARRMSRWLVNAVKNLTPLFLLRTMKGARLALRPESAFTAVQTAAYGGQRDCLRVVARRKAVP
jgi:hypothetical protein